MNTKKRCKWCNEHNRIYLEYHDKEWCVPRFDDKYLYEMLILESFQAGLSWECVLNKRESFRLAYDSFDIDKVIAYNDDKVRELITNSGIIRNKRKIYASINNTRIFKNIVVEFGSFYNYLIKFTNGKTIYEVDRVTNELSDAISRDLQERGMTFVGSVIIYSYLQAIGIIYSHDKDCYLYRSREPEKSCGFVAFRELNGVREYLIIRSVNGEYGLPKGHIEPREDEIEAATRELKEETNVEVTALQGFRREIEYELGRGSGCYKRCVYFLGKAVHPDIICQKSEVSEARFMPLTDALSLVTHNSIKEILCEAEAHISSLYY